MRLKPSAAMMLGMIRLGARSGYAIKKATDSSTRFFWPTSLAQVYPELSRLERARLVRRRDDSHGARKRSAYELTEEGEDALLGWLAGTREVPAHFRDEGLLRLFFADALVPEEQLALVQRLRRRARAESERLRDEILPAARGLEQGGVAFPARVAQLGADTYAYVDEWLARLESELAG